MARFLACNEIAFYAVDVDTSLASNMLLKIFDVLCIKDDKFSILNLDFTPSFKFKSSCWESPDMKIAQHCLKCVARIDNVVCQL